MRRKEINKLLLGDPLKITFLDHAQDSDTGPITCTVYGELSDIGKKHITVISWKTHDGDFENTSFTIVTSCIRDLVVLTK